MSSRSVGRAARSPTRTQPETPRLNEMPKKALHFSPIGGSTAAHTATAMAESRKSNRRHIAIAVSAVVLLGMLLSGAAAFATTSDKTAAGSHTVPQVLQLKAEAKATAATLKAKDRELRTQKAKSVSLQVALDACNLSPGPSSLAVGAPTGGISGTVLSGITSLTRDAKGVVIMAGGAVAAAGGAVASGTAHVARGAGRTCRWLGHQVRKTAFAASKASTIEAKAVTVAPVKAAGATAEAAKRTESNLKSRRSATQPGFALEVPDWLPN